MKPGLELNQCPGVQHVTWSLPDPDRWGVDAIRPLREHIDFRVQDLIAAVTGSAGRNRPIGSSRSNNGADALGPDQKSEGPMSGTPAGLRHPDKNERCSPQHRVSRDD